MLYKATEAFEQKWRFVNENRKMETIRTTNFPIRKQSLVIMKRNGISQ